MRNKEASILKIPKLVLTVALFEALICGIVRPACLLCLVKVSSERKKLILSPYYGECVCMLAFTQLLPSRPAESQSAGGKEVSTSTSDESISVPECNGHESPMEEGVGDKAATDNVTVDKETICDDNKMDQSREELPAQGLEEPDQSEASSQKGDGDASCNPGIYPDIPCYTLSLFFLVSVAVKSILDSACL